MKNSQSHILGEACRDCLVKQSQRLAKRLIQDEDERAALLLQLEERISEAFHSGGTGTIHRDVYAQLYQAAGDPDPYQSIKRRSTQQVLALYPALKEKVHIAPDPLYLAARYAISGNVIDFALPHVIDLDKELSTALKLPLAIDHYVKLKQRLSKADRLLMFGDNAGETVLDRLLIETIGLPTDYVVRNAPIINDATLEDARQAGLDQVARLIPSGSDYPGTLLNECSTEVQQLYAQAPVVISKGQGNFESLMHETREIFYLLKVKCDLVAEHLKANVGDSVLLAANVE
jgi:uncharacterized protein with ATP-grasp and redox domains